MFTRRSILAALPLTSLLPWSPAVSEPASLRDDLARHFAAVGTIGTFVCTNLVRGTSVVVNQDRADTAYLPASTFKIANALIALELGVVADADNPVFRWDGHERGIAAWNKDHTLRTAFAVSAVPVYQDIARRIGAERMAHHVAAFNYGNRDIGGALDRFWLDGELRISAIQQIAFLAKLWRDALPVSGRAQAVVKDIMRLEGEPGRRLSGKTGLTAGGLGWLVGFVEHGAESSAYALNLDASRPDLIPARLSIVKAMLGELGLYRA